MKDCDPSKDRTTNVNTLFFRCWNLAARSGCKRVLRCLCLGCVELTREWVVKSDDALMSRSMCWWLCYGSMCRCLDVLLRWCVHCNSWSVDACLTRWCLDDIVLTGWCYRLCDVTDQHVTYRHINTVIGAIVNTSSQQIASTHPHITSMSSAHQHANRQSTC